MAQAGCLCPASSGPSMIPLQMSSGDLIADRRAYYAEALATDDPAAACDLYLQALDLAPDWAAGWYRLGVLRADHGLPGAAEAFERAIASDPADRLGAALRRDMLRDRALGDTVPTAFVETLFDQYAASFDTALVDRLDYRAPQLLRAGLNGPQGRVLDLGCGTGLMGAELRPLCTYLEGWDISAEMLREAEAKALYDHLDKRDLSALAPVDATWDLVTAADVFAYLGALERITAWVSAALRPGGRFAFTVEAHDGPEPYHLRPSRRFAHSEKGLRDLLDQAGFTATLTRATLRMDRDAPIEGFVVHAVKNAPLPRHAEDGEDMAAA